MVKNGLDKSEDPLIQRLDEKYGIHDSIPRAMRNVSRGDLVMIESSQMLRYRMANEYDSICEKK